MASKGVVYAHLDYHALKSHARAALRQVFELLEWKAPGFVARINCVDSLDRTNAALVAFCSFRSVEVGAEELFGAGNAISLQFASSEAMKRAAVLPGASALAEKARDLRIWATRLFKNNFSDGKAADGFRAAQNEPSSAQERRERPAKANAAGFSLSMLALSICACLGARHLGTRLESSTNLAALETSLAAAFVCAWLALLCAFGENFASGERL